MESYPILIPAVYENRYFAIWEKIQTLCDEYMDEKLGNEVFDDISALLDDNETLIAEIQQYVKRNISNRFVPNRDIIGLLKSKPDSSTLLEELKQTGKITKRNIHAIDEPEFMKSIVKDLNDGFSLVGISVEQVDTERKGYLIKLLPYSNILLFCKHSAFVGYFGGLVFGENIGAYPDYINKILSMGEFNDEKSIDAALERLNSLAENWFYIVDYSIDFNNALIWKAESNEYFITDLKFILKKFKALIFGAEKKPFKTLIKYIEGRKRTIDELQNQELYPWIDLQNLREFNKKVQVK